MILLSLCRKLFNRSLLYLFTTKTDPEKSPKVHIPALNHIGLWVDNLDSAFSSLTSKGIRFAGGIRMGAGRDKNKTTYHCAINVFFLFFLQLGTMLPLFIPRAQRVSWQNWYKLLQVCCQDEAISNRIDDTTTAGGMYEVKEEKGLRLVRLEDNSVRRTVTVRC